VDVLLEILKWVLIVFVAGVIGQLGKSLTLKILDERRKKKEAAGAQSTEPPLVPLPAKSAAPDAKTAKELTKQQKKTAKAQQKRRKKASD